MGEREKYKEERGVFEEVRKKEECDMEGFGTLDSRVKMVAILGGRL